MSDTYKNLLLEIKELHSLALLYHDSKFRRSIIDQLILVRNNIIVSGDKDLIDLLKNYYLDLPFTIFFIRIKLQTPPILGLIIVFIAAAVIRNAYINQYSIIFLLLGVILALGVFIICYLAFARENSAIKIASFSYEAIKILEEKTTKKRR